MLYAGYNMKLKKNLILPGIPSTLNYVELSNNKSPHLKRYPGSENLTSVYRPRIDVCGRLWMVDTGLLEVPGMYIFFYFIQEYHTMM